MRTLFGASLSFGKEFNVLWELCKWVVRVSTFAVPETVVFVKL